MSNQTAGHARTENNRQRRIAKATRFKAWKAAHPPKVARGTARYIRRHLKQVDWAHKHQKAA